MLYTVIDSPLEPLLLTADGAALTGLYLTQHLHGGAIAPHWQRDDQLPVFVQARQQLAAYFNGTLHTFDLPLAPVGTAFQQRVWAALQRIPYGSTTTYGTLAQQLGNPRAPRAVGLANGRNPLSIIVPCHRVIGVKGRLTGYAGGLKRKAALLAFESDVVAHGPRVFTP